MRESSRTVVPFNPTLINPKNMRASLAETLKANKGVKVLDEKTQLRISEFVDIATGVIYKQDNKIMTKPEDVMEHVSVM